MHDINVYGRIGWYDRDEDEGMDAKTFSRLLREADGDDVTVHINSVGGNVFEANAMAELLRSYKGRAVAVIEGLAASAASYFALTAAEVRMNPAALFMIHNPSSLAIGTAEDMRACADRLDKVRGTISGQYVDKTGMDAVEVERLMDEETWFTASEALERGFVDSLTTDAPVTAMVTEEDIARFRNAPDGLAGEAGASIPPEPEDEAGAGAAAAAETGAAPRVTCSHGLFIKS